jgi:hypothetical protein
MTIYTCPMHPEIQSDKPGKCPKCGGMDLIPKDSNELTAKVEATSKLSEYKPLIVIISLILLATIALGIRDQHFGAFSWERIMADFMAGFFLVFSGFKLLDIKGFAHGYSSYDLLAGQVPSYGYIYPFIELILGLLFLVGNNSIPVLVITLVVMLFSGLGVAKSIAQKKKFQCACLGTIIKVPLTTVTLIEDFGMAAMALVMLFLRLR